MGIACVMDNMNDWADDREFQVEIRIGRHWYNLVSNGVFVKVSRRVKGRNRMEIMRMITLALIKRDVLNNDWNEVFQIILLRYVKLCRKAN